MVITRKRAVPGRGELEFGDFLTILTSSRIFAFRRELDRIKVAVCEDHVCFDVPICKRLLDTWKLRISGVSLA